jgi:hypothetical protein
MNRYRLHLFDAQERMRVGHWLQAEDDDTALWIAEHLYDACSDVFASFSLWHRERSVMSRRPPRPRAQTSEDVVERRQRMLAFHEEALLDSACRIEASQRLLDRLRGAKTI